MPKTLVIVESPAKAKTINKYLGTNFIVKSSFGHLRDLSKTKMGIDVEDNFKPNYINDKTKTKVIKELQDSAEKTKQQVLFATDEDREGEAISWHLAKILDIPENEVKRIVFHEITKDAILKAVDNPRALDMNLVNAQQARRILDRLVGFELSPFLWRKVARGLSAGRVQSVAVRLVVEREREIQNFKPEEYWTVEGIFSKITSTNTNKESEFSAKLNKIAGKVIKKFALNTQEQTDEILKQIANSTYQVKNIEQKETKKSPLPPFTTSTLQQSANNRLGFSAKQTMRLAQQLYEGIKLNDGIHGLITYMRTDSLNLSEKFLGEAHEVITKEFGVKYAMELPRFFKKKSKNAQEAHEAIRPTEAMRTPQSIKQFLDPRQYKLYDLIWKRAVASQMSSAIINKVVVDIENDTKQYEFRANGQTITFDGYLKLFPDITKENILPNLAIKDNLNCLAIKPEQHFTEPPARYSDATLVKILEEYGIGRPSTYAPTIATIESRGYVERNEQKRLVPRDIAFLVNDILVAHFSQIVDYDFTAKMENDLDDIAEGKKKWQPVISEFYFPFKENLTKKDKELDKKDLTEEETKEKCEKCGSPMLIKVGRFGKFMACSNYPECKSTKPMPGEDRDKNGQADSEEIKTLKEKFQKEICEKCGEPMVVKIGRFGAFLGCSGYPKCKNIKNITSENEKTGVICPVCGKGEIVQKKSRRGIFYACNQYPDCKTAFWGKPTGDKCEKCHSLLLEDKKGIIKCSNTSCKQ